MLTCEKCNLSLIGSPNSCPLCQGDVHGTPDYSENVFPNIPINETHNSLLKTVSVGVIILSLITFSINLMFSQVGGWSILVICALVSLWISFYFVIKNKNKIPKSIFFQVVILSLLTESWDSYTGYHRWAITYVIPIIISCAIIFIFTFSMARKLYVGDYVLYLLVLSILGIIGFSYLKSTAVTVLIPMGICLVISYATILLLLIFKYKDIWSEIQRRFHF